MTLLGLGSSDQNRAESLDMLGMHGSAYANYAVQQCDLLIAVGARFDDRVTGKIATFAPNAKVVHIDIDPASISKNVRVDIPVVGDAKEILTELVKEVQYNERKEWFDKIAEFAGNHKTCGSAVQFEFLTGHDIKMQDEFRLLIGCKARHTNEHDGNRNTDPLHTENWC